MSNAELMITTAQAESQVGLAMTPAAFTRAQEANVLRVEADIDAMQYIARQVGALEPGQKLPSQIVVARDGGQGRSMIGHWDDRLPKHIGDATTGLYLPATQLAEKQPQTANRERLVSVADAIGAKALTEVTVEGWTEEDRRLHAAAFAGGLLLGQRPLVLGPRPSLGVGLIKGLAATQIEGRYAHVVEEYRRNPASLPNPFVVTYKDGAGMVPRER